MSRTLCVVSLPTVFLACSCSLSKPAIPAMRQTTVIPFTVWPINNDEIARIDRNVPVILDMLIAFISFLLFCIYESAFFPGARRTIFHPIQLYGEQAATFQKKLR